MMGLGQEWQVDDVLGPRHRSGFIQRVTVEVTKVTRSSVWAKYPNGITRCHPWYYFFVDLNASPTQLLREEADEAVKWDRNN